MRIEPTISTLTAIRSIQMAKRDSDGYRIRKSKDLKSILLIMFANLKLVLRSYTSLYSKFMSASLTLYIYSFVFSPCIVVQYFVSFLVLQSLCWERDSWLSSGWYAAVIVLCLLTVPWVGMWCVILAFPDHAHFFFHDNICGNDRS